MRRWRKKTPKARRKNPAEAVRNSAKETIQRVNSQKLVSERGSFPSLSEGEAEAEKSGRGGAKQCKGDDTTS